MKFISTRDKTKRNILSEMQRQMFKALVFSSRYILENENFF